MGHLDCEAREEAEAWRIAVGYREPGYVRTTVHAAAVLRRVPYWEDRYTAAGVHQRGVSELTQ